MISARSTYQFTVYDIQWIQERTKSKEKLVEYLIDGESLTTVISKVNLEIVI
jgi:hypothetical protein